jgi:hypothetical protein
MTIVMDFNHSQWREGMETILSIGGHEAANAFIRLIQREFDIAICVVRSPTQMAKNGKNRLAILTIFRFRRTDVNSRID